MLFAATSERRNSMMKAVFSGAEKNAAQKFYGKLPKNNLFHPSLKIYTAVTTTHNTSSPICSFLNHRKCYSNHYP
jgi:hypothetical protein